MLAVQSIQHVTLLRKYKDDKIGDQYFFAYADIWPRVICGPKNTIIDGKWKKDLKIAKIVQN